MAFSLFVMLLLFLLLLQDVICNAVFGNSLDLVPSDVKSGYGAVPRSVAQSSVSYLFPRSFLLLSA